MQKILSTLLCSFFSIVLLAQAPIVNEIYSRVKIYLGDQTIQDLAALGLEVDHGVYRKGVFLMNDFSEREIKTIKQAGFYYEIEIEDVTAHYLSQEEIPNVHFKGGGCADDQTPPKEWTTPEQYTYGSMGGYLTLTELYEVLDTMTARYPNLISPKTAIDTFKTVGGRPIYAIKISNNPTVDEDKPKILYTALHHAREPNSLSQLVFYIWYLLENYETDSEIKFLVDHVEMYFIPCVNPDGYVYNQTSNPNGGGLWRKNRSVENGSVVGVDLNRNYSYKWGDDNAGSSPNPEDETYRGNAPASEPEIKAVNFLCNEHQFEIALNYHTFGDLLIHPWGYSDQITAEHTTFSTLGAMLTQENHFLFGTGTQTVGYTVNGDSDDWMYGVKGIFSMTPEVGGSFWPPESQIDKNNKTTIYQNIIAAQLLLNFAQAKLTTNAINPVAGSFDVVLTHPGLKTGPTSVAITSLTSGFDINTTPIEQNLTHLDTANLVFDYTVSGNIINGDYIKIILSTNNDVFSQQDTIAFRYWENSTVSFLETGESLQLWNGDWESTSAEYYSPSTSITDSPGGNYPANFSISILSPELDLTSVFNAELSFFTKWEIEKGWDYAQVYATKDDGLNIQPLCGLWTVQGNDKQDEGQPIYDGFQTQWVEEIIDLQEFVGQKIKIGFRIVTDAYEQEDGYYFDQFKIITHQNPSSVTHKSLDLEVSIRPNPVVDFLNIQLAQNTKSDLKIRVINTLGMTLKKDLIRQGAYEFSLDVLDLNSGIYFVELKSESGYWLGRFIKKG